MIKKNLAPILLFAMVSIGNLFAENAVKEKSDIQEQKIESNNAKLAKGIAAGLGATACAYFDAIILNWCTHKLYKPNGYIDFIVDQVGMFFFERIDIKGFNFGIPNAKLVASVLLGIPTTLLGLYLASIAYSKLIKAKNIKETTEKA